MNREKIAKDISDNVEDLFYENVLQYPGKIIYKKIIAGTILSEPGSSSKDLYFIKKGIVRGYHQSEDYQEKTVYIRLENDFFGDYYSVIINSPTKLHCECIEECELYQFDYDEIEKYFKNNIAVMNFAFTYLMKVFFEYISRNEDFISLNPEERYVKYTLNNRYLIDRVPAKYIASLLGVTPVSLSRIKKRFQDKNNIED